MNRTVRYDHFGDPDVLYIAQLAKPQPQAHQVLVRVKVAGINPGETLIRTGALQHLFPSTFPSGQGSDFAGIIEATGAGVTQFRVGEEVIGFTNDRNSQADYIAVAPSQLIRRPAQLDWLQAGGLFVAGTTAYAAIEALNLQANDVLIVSGAAGGWAAWLCS